MPTQLLKKSVSPYVLVAMAAEDRDCILKSLVLHPDPALKTGTHRHVLIRKC